MYRHSLLVSTLAVVTAQVVDLVDCLEINGDINFCRVLHWSNVLFLLAGKSVDRDALTEMLLVADDTDDVTFSSVETVIGFNTGTSAKLSMTELGVVDTTLLISSHF